MEPTDVADIDDNQVELPPLPGGNEREEIQQRAFLLDRVGHALQEVELPERVRVEEEQREQRSEESVMGNRDASSSSMQIVVNINYQDMRRTDVKHETVNITEGTYVRKASVVGKGSIAQESLRASSAANRTESNLTNTEDYGRERNSDSNQTAPNNEETVPKTVQMIDESLRSMNEEEEVPESILETSSRLSNVRLTENQSNVTENSDTSLQFEKGNDGTSSSNRGRKACYKCGEVGHVPSHCPHIAEKNKNREGFLNKRQMSEDQNVAELDDLPEKSPQTEQSFVRKTKANFGKRKRSLKKVLVSMVGTSNTSSKAASMTNIPLSTDMKKIIQAQEEYEEGESVIHEIDAPDEDIPIVHPRIFEVDLYRGEAAPKEETYKPSTEYPVRVESKREIKFDELFRKIKRKRCVCFAGFPGAGKTTFTKRLVKTNEWVTFNLKFHEMDYKEDVTLKKILLDHAYPDLEQSILDGAFSWVKKHQEHVMIIMDGLDQAAWSFDKTFPKLSYDSPQHVSNIVASLFNKHFLKKARIVVTSRLHAMLLLPYELRPDAIYLLKDLSVEDMKKLFFFLTKDDADRLWFTLNRTAPQLVSLCLRPLILLLYIRAARNPSKNVGKITTMTRYFATVLENLRRSGHIRGLKDVKVIMDQLATLAFRITRTGKVVITLKELKAVGLRTEEVQDFVILLYGGSDRSCNLFEGDEHFYFCHQNFQEYFAALYICKLMNAEDFKGFVDDLFTDQWSMVAKFVCGLLIDLQETSDECEKKRRTLVAEMLRRMENISSAMSEEGQLFASASTRKKLRVSVDALSEAEKNKHLLRQRLIDLCVNVRESNNSHVTKKMADLLPTNLDMTEYTFTASSAHALCSLLKETGRKIEKLDLHQCNLNHNTFSYFVEAIKAMKGQVGMLNIGMNKLTDVYQLCVILYKIENWVGIYYCFDGSMFKKGHRHASEEELEKLEFCLNFNGTNLKIYLYVEECEPTLYAHSMKSKEAQQHSRVITCSR